MQAMKQPEKSLKVHLMNETMIQVKIQWEIPAKLKLQQNYGQGNFRQPFNVHLLRGDLTDEDLSAFLKNSMLNDNIINFFKM